MQRPVLVALCFLLCAQQLHAFSHGHAHDHAHSEDEPFEDHVFETLHISAMTEANLDSFVDLLIDAPHDREGVNTTKLMLEHGNGDGQLNKTEFKPLAYELLSKVYDLQCASEVTIRTPDGRDWDFKLTAATATTATGAPAHDDHAGHDHRRSGDHDDHDDHDHGTTTTSAAAKSPSVIIGGNSWTGTAKAGTEPVCDSHAGHGHGEEDLQGEKIGYLFLILALGLIGGLLPIVLANYFLANAAVVKRYLSLGNAFSGGVFLATGLIHILPEAEAMFRISTCIIDNNGVSHTFQENRYAYPIIPLCVVLGFVIVLGCERVLFAPWFKKSNNHGIPACGTEPAGVSAEIGHSQPAPVPAAPAWGDDKESNGWSGMPSNGFPEGVAMSQFSAPTAGTWNSAVPDGAQSPSFESAVPRQIAATAVKHVDDGHDHAPSEHSSLLTAYMLLFALGLHSLFAGFALGLTEEKAELLSLLIAITSHKSVEAIALGTAFVKSNMERKRAIGLVIFFAVVTPVGIGIGIGLEDADLGVTSAVIQATATGAFLYVGMTEVIPHEFSPQHSGNSSLEMVLRFIMLLIGAGAIALAALNTHEH